MRKLSLVFFSLIFALAACGSNVGDEEEQGASGEQIGVEYGENLELPEDMPDDFNFSLKYGYEAADEMNTYDDTYTKNLINDGVKTIDFTLTDEDMELAYEELKNADILNTPDQVSEQSCVDPHEENIVTMTVNGEDFEREWLSAECDEYDERLSYAIKTIHLEIVEPRSEYHELPEPSGGYD